jgi:hypothetical protein
MSNANVAKAMAMSGGKQKLNFIQPLAPVKKDMTGLIPKFEDQYDDDDPIDMKSLEMAKQIPDDIDFNAKLQINMKLKQKIVQVSSSSSLTLPMMVALRVDELKSSSKANIDLICVIDHSGSMKGEKLQLVKSTFEYLLKILTEKDRLCVIIFDDKASRVTRLMVMNEKGRLITRNKVNAIEPQGGTNISLGLCHAFQVLKQRKFVNQVTSLFLLSDGLDSGAYDRVSGTLSLYNLNDLFTINCFGYGNDHDPILMNSISKLKDGNFYFIDKVDTVDECFVDCLGALISVAAQDVSIVVKPEQSHVFKDVKLVKGYGGAQLWTTNNGCYCTGISQLISGLEKSYILEIQIPKTQKELNDVEKNIKVASVTVSFKPLGSLVNFEKTADLVVTFINEFEEVKDQEPDADVIVNHLRLRQAEILHDAMELSNVKKFEEARKLLQNFKEEVTNSKYKNDVVCQNILINIEQSLNNIKPEVYEGQGKHYMVQQHRAELEQRSNQANSINLYQNSAQKCMVSDLRSFKSKKV